MSSETKQILVAAYANEEAARKAYKAVLAAGTKSHSSIESVAMVEKRPGGKLRIKESDDTSGGRGAKFGAVVGGAVGLLGGLPGVLLGAGIGALAAGLYSRWRDTGLPDEQLRALGDTLDLGDAAVVAVAGADDVEEVAALLDKVALRVTNAAISADMSSTIFDMEDITVTEEEAEEAAIVPPEPRRATPVPDPEPADDLEAIDGIGPTYAERLTAAGVTRFGQLAALTPAEVMAISKVRSESSAAAWIAAAQALA